MRIPETTVRLSLSCLTPNPPPVSQDNSWIVGPHQKQTTTSFLPTSFITTAWRPLTEAKWNREYLVHVRGACCLICSLWLTLVLVLLLSLLDTPATWWPALLKCLLKKTSIFCLFFYFRWRNQGSTPSLYLSVWRRLSIRASSVLQKVSKSFLASVHVLPPKRWWKAERNYAYDRTNRDLAVK